MQRVILFSGKGGVGKTTVSAATALAAARRGYRTLVMSIDKAHSLSDAFDRDVGLFDHNAGLPLRVAENLDLQEIDVQADVQRHWQDVHRYVSQFLLNTGVDGVIAEEVAVIPGMEDIVALMYINQYVTRGTYDVVVLDAPPTGESLRFVNIQATIAWYMRKRFGFDRTISRVAGGLLERLTDMPMPDDGYFAGLKQMYDRLDGVDALLRDPAITTVRLVTNAEKMVVRETQRAYMYFNLYGMTTDQIVVNRLMRDPPPQYAGWAQQQAAYVEQIRAYFSPVDVDTLPLFDQEVVGLARLAEVADALYGDADPTPARRTSPPYRVTKRDDHTYLLRLDLPFVRGEELQLTRSGEEVVIRLGNFKRHVPLPHAMQRLETVGAEFEDTELVLAFAEPAATRR